MKRLLNYTLNRPLSFRNEDDSITNAYDLGTDKAIESTCIDNARYDGHNMHITFKGGDKEYTYPDVPESVAKRFEYATSYGKAFNQDIKPYSSNAVAINK